MRRRLGSESEGDVNKMSAYFQTAMTPLDTVVRQGWLKTCRLAAPTLMIGAWMGA